MNILFISRAYPPVTGGIENQNYALSVWLPRYATVKTLANRHGRAFLPLFAPYEKLFHRQNLVLWFAKTLFERTFLRKTNASDADTESSNRSRTSPSHF